MPRVTHFEIHYDDLRRIQAFYSSLFGWTFEKWPGVMEYWIVKTGSDPMPGINGGLVKRKNPGPQGNAPVNAFICSVDGPERAQSVLDRAVAIGGSVAAPVQDIGGSGELCYIKDPEGNIVGYIGPPQLKVPQKNKL